MKFTQRAACPFFVRAGRVEHGEKNPTLRGPRVRGRQDSPVRGLPAARSISHRHPRRTRSGAHAGGSLRRLAHGRGHVHRPHGARERQPPHHERLLDAHNGPHALRHPLQRPRRLHRRPHRLQVRRRGVLRRGQRRQPREGLRAHGCQRPSRHHGRGHL